MALCPRCLELEDEIEDLRQRLAAVGQYVIASPGPNHVPDCEHELRRWLAVHPRADAAAGFRAGWARLARVVGPRLREWEARWWRMARENDSLRSRLGSLVAEVSRLNEPRQQHLCVAHHQIYFVAGNSAHRQQAGPVKAIGRWRWTRQC